MENSSDNTNPGMKVYKGARFDVYSLQIPGSQGRLVKRDLVVHPGAVVILPLLDPEHIVMIRNERFAVGKTLWELPAGTLEKNESPIMTAKRELIEETGYQAGKIEALTQFYTSPGFCTEMMHAYVARDLIPIGQALEESEKITVEIVSWEQALNMAGDGTIIDGKTLTTLLFFKFLAN